MLHCSNVSCNHTGNDTITPVDPISYVGEDASIAIGADGLPVTSHTSQYALKVQHCSNPACSDTNNNTITYVDNNRNPTHDTGNDTSITIGADGLPVISYLDDNTALDLKLVHCGNVSCTVVTP